MACNKCNDPCEGNPVSDCLCPQENYTDCIIYRGENLSCIGLTEGDRLTVALSKIDEKLCNQVSVTNENVGDAAEVYKQRSVVTGNEQFRTLVSSDNSVEITQEEDTIDVKVIIAPDSITQITSVGSGADVYKGLNGTIQEIKTIISSDNSVGILAAANTLDITVEPTTTQITSVGSGIDVHQGLNGTIQELRTIGGTDSIDATIISPGTIGLEVNPIWLNAQILEWVSNNTEIICQIVSNCPCVDLLTIEAEPFLFDGKTACTAAAKLRLRKCPNETISVQFIVPNIQGGSVELLYAGITYTLTSSNPSITIPNIILNSQGEAIIEANIGGPEGDLGDNTVYWINPVNNQQVELSGTGCPQNNP
jgi:hypothetical protein